MRRRPTNVHPLRLLLALALAGLATAAPASAAVRTAAGPVTEGVPLYGPASVSAVYDDAAGTVEVQTVATIPPPRGTEYEVVLSATCAGENEPTDAPPELHLSLRADGTPNPPAKAVIQGRSPTTLPATATVDGSNLTLAASGPSLRGRDWRCVNGLRFEGYEPLTTQRAVAALRASLAATFKVAGKRITVNCDDPQDPEKRIRTAPCRAQLRRKGRATAIVATVDNRDGPGARVRTSSTRSFSQRVVRCGRYRAPRRTGIYQTTITALSIDGRFTCGSRKLQYLLERLTSLAVDWYPRAPGAKLVACEDYQGLCTQNDPFAAPSTFPCKQRSKLEGGARHYALRCANRVGDRFTVNFTGRQVASPSPGES